MIGTVILVVLCYLATGLIIFGIFAKISGMTMDELEEKDGISTFFIFLLLWPLVAVFFSGLGIFLLYKILLKHVFKLSKNNGELQEKKDIRTKKKKEKAEARAKIKAKAVALAKVKAEKNIGRSELLDFEK